VQKGCEVPVGNAKEVMETGSFDASAAVLLDLSITDWLMSLLELRATFPETEGHEKIDLRNFIYGSGAVEADAGKGLSLLSRFWDSQPSSGDRRGGC